MALVGSADTRLVVLRGNSASGKTTTAIAVQAAHKGHVARVSQDVMRREVLRIGDGDDNPSIGLIETVARYSLDQGFHVLVEGILHSGIYGEMLRRLVADHAGTTRCYRYVLSFDETVARHASKPQAAVYGAAEMREWYRPDDPIEGLDEQLFDASVSQDAAVATILAAHDWPALGQSRGCFGDG